MGSRVGPAGWLAKGAIERVQELLERAMRLITLNPDRHHSSGDSLSTRSV